MDIFRQSKHKYDEFEDLINFVEKRNLCMSKESIKNSKRKDELKKTYLIQIVF